MRSKIIHNMVLTAIVAAIYAVATIALAPISYAMVQFRFSEILVLFAFVDRKYIPGLVLGCFLANLYSQLGVLDVIFGTLATYLSVLLVSKTKNFFVASLWPSIINGVIIGVLLHVVADFPLFLAIASVALGEFVVVSLVGVAVFKTAILRNKSLMKLLRIS